MNSTKKKSSSFHLGDKVLIEMGRRTFTGEIVEDRGFLGVRGKHLFRVQVPMEPYDPMTMEVTEDEMKAAPAETPLDDKDKIIEFLVFGGLTSILRSGQNQPRVWLCRDQIGNLTYTFIPERGLIGGQPIPFPALKIDKVIATKKDAVIAFLEGFNLSPEEAKKVISKVGVAR